ncbi:hypothetical protein GCM10022199_07190 [Marihabitans asiaticum]|uniref:Uncharacterized protein YabE (DUF348 family) n=1 Tax=Marihabitans asiaticum TaxID=415218 RepID=A0A560WDL8_9MICO|nr:resuscitation-promoting factor [Marihabitans asiaticum]TWD15624.1 uncharacterized protein YabE (DUF348 family) [Marihabitans asiaticum]
MTSVATRRIAQAGVVGGLVLGVSGVAVMDKSVALDVDGEKSSAHAFGGTVEDVLDKQGIEVGERDQVTPALDTPVEDGQEIVVRYARQLTITVDGEKKTYWTTATTVGDALEQLGLRGEGAILSASRSQSLGRDGLSFSMTTPKDVTLVVAGKKSKETVNALNVGQALKALEVKFDSDDKIAPGKSKPVTDGMTIRVDEIEKKSAKKTEAIPFETVVKKDDSKEVGTSTVSREGKAGSRTVTYEVTSKNGKQVSQKQTGSKVTSEPVAKIVVQGTKPKPQPKPAPSSTKSSSSSTKSSSSSAKSSSSSTKSSSSSAKSSTPAPKSSSTSSKRSSSSSSSSSSSGSGLNLARAAMWDRIAQCESTGNWSINTGNGYYGGLQFNIGTWLSVGGGDFASRPDLASRAEQITVANRLYAQRGLQPWGCAHAA